MASEAEHVGPGPESEVLEFWDGAEVPAGGDDSFGVGVDLEVVDVFSGAVAVAVGAGERGGVVGPAGAFAGAAVEGVVDGAGGFGALGGVFGQVPGNLAGAEGGVGAGRGGDAAQVELVAPADGVELAEGYGLGWFDLGSFDGGADGGVEELGGGAGGWGLVGLGAVEAEDGVEVDRSPGLVFGDFGDRHPPDVPPGPLGDAEELGGGPVDQGDGAVPQCIGHGVEDDGGGVVVGVGVEGLADGGVVGLVATIAAGFAVGRQRCGRPSLPGRWW